MYIGRLIKQIMVSRISSVVYCQR